MDPKVAHRILMGYMNGYLAIPEAGRPPFEGLMVRGASIEDWALRALAVTLLGAHEQDVAAAGVPMPPVWKGELHVINVGRQLFGDETRINIHVSARLTVGFIHVWARARIRPVVPNGPVTLALCEVYGMRGVPTSYNGRVLPGGAITAGGAGLGPGALPVPTSTNTMSRSPANARAGGDRQQVPAPRR
jgi:hypothetical protein